MSAKCHMVCDSCGHVDTGPEHGTYECEKCGSGSGWGYALTERDRAEAKGREIREKGAA